MPTYSLLEPLDIVLVLQLQKENLKECLNPETQEQQGFLTISHSHKLLEQMNAMTPSVVAKEGSEIAGFCLAMTREFEKAIPALVPMFDIFNDLSFKGKPLNRFNYLVVGQVCVAEKFRGRGVFDALYKHYKNTYATSYEMAVTEINARNLRSMAAHKRVGFEYLHQYQAPDGEVWNIVVWKW